MSARGRRKSGAGSHRESRPRGPPQRKLGLEARRLSIIITCRSLEVAPLPAAGLESEGFEPFARAKTEGGWCSVADPTVASEAEKRIVYGITEIMKFLPHRYPFLLVDRIVELEPEKRIVGLKNVTINEQFFQGHFPGAPVMPGVLIIEAMAQVAGVMIYRDLPNREKKLIYFTSIENARFRRPVVPGDQLRIEMELLARRNNFGKMSGRATVDGKLVAEAVVMFAIAGHPGHPDP